MVRFSSFAESDLVCDTLGEQSLVAVFRGYNAVLKEFNRLFSRFGLSEAQFNILLLLVRQGKEGMMLSDIGQRMLVSKADITGLADRLEREGLIVRDGRLDDRRAKVAKITDKGLELVKKVVPLHCETINRITSVLGEPEKKALVQTLEKLARFPEEGRG